MVNRNLTFGLLDPADEIGYADPEPVKYEPQLASDGLSTSIDVLYIEPKTSDSDGGGGKGGKK